MDLAPETHDAAALAALVFAIAGDRAHARRVADTLTNRFPDDTQVKSYWLPTVEAQLLLNRGNSQAAIDELQATIPLEFGSPVTSWYTSCLYPVYIRGLAYIAAKDGREASAEFGKIVEHPGLVATCPVGALAHLELGRAYVLQNDTGKARSAYKRFLTLWKDADSDIPILKQAKAEYAMLQ